MTTKTANHWLPDIAAVLCLVATLVFVVVYVGEQRTWATPETTTGVLTDRRAVIGNSEGVDYCTVTYSFTDGLGREYRGRSDLDFAFCSRSSVGDHLDVEFVRGNPGMSRVRGQASVQLIGQAAIVLLLPAGLFVYLGPRRWLRMWRGEPDPGPFT